MNPDLARLQPYPFEKLRHLFAGLPPAPAPCGPSGTFCEIKLSIGEPQHPTPPFIQRALADSLAGLASYPTTQGSDALRQAIAAWIGRRHGVPTPDFMTQVVPVNGSREALFAFAQAVIDRGSQRGDGGANPDPGTAPARFGDAQGARPEVVEGVIGEDNCAISMGVYIGRSTEIYDRASGEVMYGRIPQGSLAVGGNLPSADGKYSLYCAVIVKRVDARTRAPTAVNELLRD